MEFCPCVIERGDLGQMYDRKCGRRYDSYRTPISVTKRFPLGFGLMMMMHTLLGYMQRLLTVGGSSQFRRIVASPLQTGRQF